jgi:hypothetical protein
MHSSIRRAERHARAVERGYLVKREARWIEVPPGLHEHARVVTDSLILHKEHDELASTSSHFARHASKAALDKGRLTDQQFRDALAVHRRANRAKHSVSQACRSESQTKVPSTMVDDLPMIDAISGSTPPCVASPAVDTEQATHAKDSFDHMLDDEGASFAGKVHGQTNPEGHPVSAQPWVASHPYYDSCLSDPWSALFEVQNKFIASVRQARRMHAGPTTYETFGEESGGARIETRALAAWREHLRLGSKVAELESKVAKLEHLRQLHSFRGL